MSAFLESPRVRDLLRQADNAEALRRKLAEQGADTAAVRATLDAVLRDLGHAVWTGARTEAVLPEPSETLRGDDEDQWYTEEIELPRRLFDPGDLAGVDELETDERTDPAIASFRLESLAAAELRRDDPADALAMLRAGEAPWADQVAGLRELLGRPTTDEREAALGQEAARVQWGASNVEEQLSGLPDPVRTVVVAALACRAHRVKLLLGEAIGLDLALERLRRFRVSQRLPMVVPLSSAPRPERGAWIRDARAWWALIDPAAR